MAGSTTRLGLIKPTDAEFQDVAVLNSNADRIDEISGLMFVTSGTRPASPFVGQLIRETDTGITYTWDGTNWVWIAGDWNFAYSRDTSFSAPVNTAQVITGATLSRSNGPLPGTPGGGIFQLSQGTWAITMLCDGSGATGQNVIEIVRDSSRIIAFGTISGSGNPNMFASVTINLNNASNAITFRQRSVSVVNNITNMAFYFAKV